MLGFTLPKDWSGRVRVEGFGTETVDGQKLFTTILANDVEPEAWGVFAQHRDGKFAMLASLPSQQQADELAERLAVIDAHPLDHQGATAKCAQCWAP